MNNILRYEIIKMQIDEETLLKGSHWQNKTFEYVHILIDRKGSFE